MRCAPISKEDHCASSNRTLFPCLLACLKGQQSRFEHGVMPLYTPVGGSWLNMAEPVQRIIVRRALAGQHPKNAQQVIDWLEQTVDGWNTKPTPFVWNGKRRERARLSRQAAQEQPFGFAIQLRVDPVGHLYSILLVSSYLLSWE